MLEKIPWEMMDGYNDFFEAYDFGRTFIDAIKHLEIGHLWVDNSSHPVTLLFSIPCISILAGNPNSSSLIELLAKIPERDLILIPNVKWLPPIQNYWGAKLYTRVRERFDPSSLRLKKVKTLISPLPQGYSLEVIDLASAQYIDSKIFPFISHWFGSASNFLRDGIGFCIKEDDQVASFAASAFPYDENLVVQVVTVEKYRRKGLGTIVSAKLIEYCLEHEITPVWETENEISKKMALKFGYRNPKSYTCYSWAVPTSKILGFLSRLRF